MPTAYLSLGSNLGDRLGCLAAGLALLTASGDPELVAVSAVYETAPWGKTDVPAYLNCVAAVRTTLPPRELLRRCLAVEAACRRVREVRWGSRTLDVDILLYGQKTVAEPDLEIPHPRLDQRAFVLVPLMELAPHLRLPDGRPLAGILPGVADQVVYVHMPAGHFRGAIRAECG